MAQKISWLDFLGINYRANVWLNGKKIADAKDVAERLRLSSSTSQGFAAGKANALAVEISAPEKNDLGITWVDWNPLRRTRIWGSGRKCFSDERRCVAA